MDQRITSTCEPLFFRSSDLPTNQGITPLLICDTLSDIIDSRLIEGAQNIHGLWRIYVKSIEARTTLLTRGINLQGHHITFKDKNPRLTDSSARGTVEKIVIRDLPLSVDNEQIRELLKTFPQVKLTSPIKYSHERRQDDNTLTKYKNGDRFFYAEHPITPILPNKTKVGDFTVRIWHNGQKNVCRGCRIPGHKFKDPGCESYDPTLDVFPFRSHENIFSNFYPCTITYRQSKFKSSEHAYQWIRAITCEEPDIAEEIKRARHAGIAKAIAENKLPKDNEKWADIRCDVMRSVIEAKMKCVPDFYKAMIDSQEKILCEATGDLFWACGLPPDVAKCTKPQFWPGTNMLGLILMDVRNDELEELKYLASKEPTEKETDDILASAENMFSSMSNEITQEGEATIDPIKEGQDKNNDNIDETTRELNFNSDRQGASKTPDTVNPMEKDQDNNSSVAENTAAINTITVTDQPKAIDFSPMMNPIISTITRQIAKGTRSPIRQRIPGRNTMERYIMKKKKRKSSRTSPHGSRHKQHRTDSEYETDMEETESIQTTEELEIEPTVPTDS
jgi:ribA/ribD-fused uncharacterized protein